MASDAAAATGGPDAAGYTFADQADGATFNYVDITGTGTLIASGDDVTGNVTLGSNFDIYGTTYSDIAVSSNGFITDLAGQTSDLSNDCPLPNPPGAGAGSFRIAALHDDLVSDVYYQYFDAAAAAGIGFGGTTNGVSIVQWSGQHFSGTPGGVDVEVVLFHDDGTILTMVNADEDAGSGSTLGIQDPTGSIGLNYGCNSAGYVEPGITAVEFSLGVAPDSDCCTASPTGTPGCTNAACQDVVCAQDAFCCATSWDGVCATDAGNLCGVLCGAPPDVRINEIRIDQTGADDDEYFEIIGTPGTPLTDIQYLVIGDTPTGDIETVIDLTGEVIPPSGFLTVAEGTFSLGVADTTTFINFENSDTVTHMLVGGFSGTISDNLDAEPDGVLDSTPWAIALDTVAVVDDGSTDFPYGPPLNCMAGPACQEVPAVAGEGAASHIYRCADGDGIWQVGDPDPLLSDDTPGAANLCAVCGDGIAEFGEVCDGDGMGMGGETATCDDDCTDVACGDGNINMTAGETCEEGGVETATCDADCTDVMCGDGTVNMTAGEACDGDGMGMGGETATCNADCSVAMCGDMIVNMSAGEDCDEGGVETADCNADCTAAMCGDGIVNATAGEECDGDGMGMGGETATCDTDCTAAMCGDGVVNNTAGETCDDMGRSAMCNADCTAATCGDGVVNMTAGEMCDDMGESDVCDDDCTDVMCGDGVANTTAGEDCDDAGESETCDDDCTPAECGDGVVNVTAGEECDDGNTEDGDECNADCTEPMAGTDTGTTGDDDDDDSTGGTTAGDDDDDDSETGLDDTAGSDDSGSGGGVTTMPMTTAGMTTMGMDDGGSDESGDGGAVPGEDGCSCTTDGSNDRNAGWMLFGLLGLGAMRRRRRS